MILGFSFYVHQSHCVTSKVTLYVQLNGGYTYHLLEYATTDANNFNNDFFKFKFEFDCNKKSEIFIKFLKQIVNVERYNLYRYLFHNSTYSREYSKNLKSHGGIVAYF